MAQGLEFTIENGCSVVGSNWSVPNLLDKIREARVQNSKGLKAKHLATRNACLDGHNAGYMIGYRLTKRLDQGIGVHVGPMQRSKEPVKLFKEWILLHIAPCI